MKIVSRAPGKAVLVGEYAVLEGAPALVAALDCEAQVTFTAARPGISAKASNAALPPPRWHMVAPQLQLEATFTARDGELVASAPLPTALRLGASLLADAYRQSKGTLPGGSLRLDTQAFYRGGHKLGFGSSAAVAVASWHALQAAGESQGKHVADEAQICAHPGAFADGSGTLSQIMQLHSQAQGGVGSGVDVAASLLGGVLRFQLPNLPGSAGAAAELARPIAQLEAAHLVFVYAGHGVSTAPFIQAFHALKVGDASLYWARLEPLAQLSAAACELWALQQTQALLPLVDAYADAMAALGDAMGMDVFSKAHRRIAEIVRKEGAAYKPSGAGGGDVGVAFCTSAHMASKVVRALRRRNLMPLGTRIARQGVTTQRVAERLQQVGPQRPVTSKSVC